jgi:hypothetical protein
MATSLAFSRQCVPAIACLGQCVGRKTDADVGIADFFDQRRIFGFVE